MIEFHSLSQSADFSPRSAARSVAASSGDAAAGRQKQFSNISTRLLMAARSALESVDLSQAAIDVLFVLFAFLFVLVCTLSVVASVFILFFVRVA